jgi:hypothetical protein
MSFFSVMANAFDRAAAFTGRPFTYKGQSYIGVVNELETSEIIDFGGFQSHISCTVAVKQDGFPEPVKGDRITVNGIVRRIVKVSNNNGVTWHLHLEDISR